MNVDLQSATSILGLVNSTVTAAKSAVELAKKSRDLELKEKVSEVLDGILGLQATVLSLEEEVRTAREAANLRSTTTRDPVHGYWFKKDEADPLCPKCFEGTDRAVYLSPLLNGRRVCRVCGTNYFESGSHGPAFSVSHSSIASRSRFFCE